MSKRLQINNNQQVEAQNDNSLYSPSSSTSLLYHIYDQINLPCDQAKKINTTTILNPENLFNIQQQQQPHLLPMQQQQCYCSTLAQYQIQQQQQQQQAFNTLHPNQQQPSYLTMRQQRQAATLARQARPLSSSGTTNQSALPITYGRQPRPDRDPLQSLNGLNSTKRLPTSALKFRSSWKVCSSRCSQLIHEYRTILNCSILLILLAFCLMSIIKFTLFSASLSPRSSSQQQQQFQSQAPPSQLLSNPFNTKLLDPPDLSSETDEHEQQRNRPDIQKSKLVIGEFVILNQNYSHSSARHSLLAERIVKLMDQVFLGTDMRRVYSRTEVTNIRPQKPSGIIVDCNIFLSESIAYAAQQFGIALYDSLTKSHEKLANHNYIIDKNSIKFNTVTDKDLKSGIVPSGLISPAIQRLLVAATSSPSELDMPSSGQPLNFDKLEDLQPDPTVPEGQSVHTEDPIPAETPALEQQEQDPANTVVWSEWSPWSSCVNKTGLCDPSRTHSRIRTCVSQRTGANVHEGLCKQRFGFQDINIEVVQCTYSCDQQLHAHQLHAAQQQAAAEAHVIMSDAPSVIGPQTAPSVLLATPSSVFGPMLTSQKSAQRLSSDSNQSTNMDFQQPSSSTERNEPASSSDGQELPSTSTFVPIVGLENKQKISCSNCTSDEVCLLLMLQKVPFCAKIKDHEDDSGCGGWCKAQNQLCQLVGENAFKCIHNSECLPHEWRCHNSACIPMSKRCDGHSNCYDSSDERDCPINI